MTKITKRFILIIPLMLDIHLPSDWHLIRISVTPLPKWKRAPSLSKEQTSKTQLYILSRDSCWCAEFYAYRGDFCTWRDLREEIRNALHNHRRLPLLPPLVEPRPIHRNVTCTSCHCSPVHGTLYRCIICPYVLICDGCVTGRQGVGVTALHSVHGLAAKQVLSPCNWHQIA
jgi:hypothetical protein